jgi:hypothetical protein
MSGMRRRYDEDEDIRILLYGPRENSDAGLWE